MKLSDFDYFLPKEMIAQEGLARRDEARLMVLKEDGGWNHDSVGNLPAYFKEGDLLVMNDTRVLRAKMIGRKKTGGKIDCLVLPDTTNGGSEMKEALLRGSRVHEGIDLTFKDSKGNVLEGKVMEKISGAKYHVKFDRPDLIPSFANVPLPPYIKKPLADSERYQTVYSAREGSLAAPTAGLHFTDRLIENLGKTGVRIVHLTLHIGIATFAPIRTENVEDWNLHGEYYEISRETAETISGTLAKGGRVFAVGTTTVRALESALAGPEGKLNASSGWTDIYIYPGYRFKLGFSGMLTNFHLPKSSLLLLVSAFAGRDRVLAAYEEAIKMRYRFYSFGDATLIFRKV